MAEFTTFLSKLFLSINYKSGQTHFWSKLWFYNPIPNTPYLKVMGVEIVLEKTVKWIVAADRTISPRGLHFFFLRFNVLDLLHLSIQLGWDGNGTVMILFIYYYYIMNTCFMIVFISIVIFCFLALRLVLKLNCYLLIINKSLKYSLESKSLLCLIQVLKNYF